jgi:hypothetical protein
MIPLLLLLLVFLVFLIRRWNEPKQKEAFDREPPTLGYAARAVCQMACRNISKEEIEEIMKKGLINFNRSNRRRHPCPAFALQGRTGSGKSLLVIFAQCPKETTVLTCFTLKDSIRCDCPQTKPVGGN